VTTTPPSRTSPSVYVSSERCRAGGDGLVVTGRGSVTTRHLPHVSNIIGILYHPIICQKQRSHTVIMPWSHHSHSGQFCGHATSTLESVVQTAIARGMTIFCLTEHMPRNAIDFYPDEDVHHDEASLARLYDDFYQEARRLQTAYAGDIAIFVGFEAEWIRESSLALIEGLLFKHKVDLFIGSVHHVHTIPIDYDTAFYHKARAVAGGTDEKLYEDYFDAQYAMLQALRPPVIGHFDLIRLKSDDPDRSFRTWPGVWGRVERNLTLAAEYGAVLELNSSSLRKGMAEAYPQVEICRVGQGHRDRVGRCQINKQHVWMALTASYRRFESWGAASPSQTTVTALSTLV